MVADIQVGFDAFDYRRSIDSLRDRKEVVLVDSPSLSISSLAGPKHITSSGH